MSLSARDVVHSILTEALPLIWSTWAPPDHCLASGPVRMTTSV